MLHSHKTISFQFSFQGFTVLHKLISVAFDISWCAWSQEYIVCADGFRMDIIARFGKVPVPTEVVQKLKFSSMDSIFRKPPLQTSPVSIVRIVYTVVLPLVAVILEALLSSCNI